MTLIFFVMTLALEIGPKAKLQTEAMTMRLKLFNQTFTKILRRPRIQSRTTVIWLHKSEPPIPWLTVPLLDISFPSSPSWPVSMRDCSCRLSVQDFQRRTGFPHVQRDKPLK